ncbi:MAG TPA: alkaline phosphatase family protein [Candidatus Polarisedimenticolia bacterium]|nr:alkaline phosphatase family protein [Candidatus Polarisedimenticolia bacterium]
MPPHSASRGRLVRAAWALALIAGAPALPTRAAEAAPAASAYDSVVVLGFDGADARLVETYMAEGRLPHLKALKEAGMFAPLRSTNPPQTPVSWASFATGLNPGRTEIFDFLRRTEGTYYPDFAMIQEGKKPLLFGARNPAILGGALAAAGFVVAFVLALVLRAGWIRAIVAGLALAVALGGGAAVAAARWLPDEVPDATNMRKGKPFWTVAAEAGLPTRVMHVPDTFPAESHDHLEMFSGLGVPDMRGRIGSPSYFTSDAAFAVTDNQFSIEIVMLAARRGRIETAVVGPYNKPFWDYVVDAAAQGATGDDRRVKREAAETALKARGVRRRLDVPFTIDATDDALSISLAGRSETLKPGGWSGFFEVPIPVNPLVDRANGLVGVVKFKLLALDPEIRLYMSPINFHPTCQPIPFTAPASLARDLLREVGMFKTLGWPIDTWSLPTGLTDEAHFIEDLEATVAVERQMMLTALGAKRERLYVQVFDFTDRVGHMLWRLHDPGHPLYDAALAARWAGEIPKSYEKMDGLVGEAMAAIGPRTALIVCSDHGFASFRRGVNYNTWLVKNGFMTLREPAVTGQTLENLFDKGKLGEFFKYTDWSRTKAYAMGLGNIYINLLGREPKGSVAPGREYDEVRDAIVRGLETLVDPETGERPVRRVYRREEIYSKFDPRVIPDLRVANADHYRVGWQTSLGEVPRDVFESNLKAWSGDHCSNDPEVVPGLLFANVKLDGTAPFIGDIHPTVLALLGLAPAEGLDGRSLVVAGSAP